MKKTSIMCAAIALTGLLLASCATNNKKATVSADLYDDQPVTESDAEAGEAIAIEKPKKEKSKVNNTGKKKKNIVEEIFTFGNRDVYWKFSEFSLFENDITGLNTRRAATVIRTDDYMAGWGSYFLLAYYYVQFDKANRTKLLSAIDAYLSDFENKKLDRKGKNTDRAYGKVAYRLDWGSVSSTTPNHGNGEGYLGYKFMKGSPYFVVSNFPFKNDHYEDSGETADRESMKLTYYFTKSQLKELAEFLSEESISSKIMDKNETYVTAESDEY